MVLSFILIQNRQYVLLLPSALSLSHLGSCRLTCVGGRQGWQSGMRRTP